ncbi:unnamed protein product [Rotaria socialis]|uniref:RRM domain-containing protein n=1 Tax=Rotaria socialis TaxID=392032 RepID=A0A820RV48_9BILA|nr:unnamed protein product [Rotaria socialis]CAF4442928.1 unnamed protein product [Rotaria socialis]
MPSAHIERYIRSIFVQNIPAGITEDLFRQMLSQFGVLIHFHMFLDPSTVINSNEQSIQTSRSYAFTEFASNDIAQKVIQKLNGLDLGGFRLVVDLLSNQAEPIMNLFEQFCATKTTVTSSSKNDPRLANATISQSSTTLPLTTATIESANITTAVTNTNNNNNNIKEDRESISNAVASLPPAQMFELMKQMKQCIEANPNEAKTLLSTNPQLAYALLQAQVVMRIVDPQVAMVLLNRTDKDVIPAPIDVKKPTQTMTQPTAAATAPLPLLVTNNPTAPFPFPVIPGVPFSMPMMAPNNATAQQAAANALFQAALFSGAGMFSGSLIPPPMPHNAQFPPVQPSFPPQINPLATSMRTPNLDENAALLLLQLDDAQLAQLPPAQSMQIRSLREQIAKTGLLPKM